MEISTKNINWAVLVTLAGVAIMGVGFVFSGTVNPVSVLGIVLGSGTVFMGQILLFRAALQIRAASILKVAPASTP